MVLCLWWGVGVEKVYSHWFLSHPLHPHYFSYSVKAHKHHNKWNNKQLNRSTVISIRGQSTLIQKTRYFKFLCSFCRLLVHSNRFSNWSNATRWFSVVLIILNGFMWWLIENYMIGLITSVVVKAAVYKLVSSVVIVPKIDCSLTIINPKWNLIICFFLFLSLWCSIQNIHNML